MKRVLLLLLAWLWSNVALSQVVSLESYTGRWEHRFFDKTSTDSEGDVLIISNDEGGSLRGIYFGIERQGEHGIFYSATPVIELTLSADGRISFTVPARLFFAKRPSSVAQSKRWTKNAVGRTHGEMHFQGTVTHRELRLTCSSTLGECPEKIMTFQKGKWVRP